MATAVALGLVAECCRDDTSLAAALGCVSVAVAAEAARHSRRSRCRHRQPHRRPPYAVPESPPTPSTPPLTAATLRAALDRFAASAPPPGTFSSAGASSSAKQRKRAKAHFRRSASAFAHELHAVLTVRHALLFDRGCLSVGGAGLLVSFLRTAVPSCAAAHLCALHLGNDTVMFVRCLALSDRLASILSPRALRPVLVDVSPQLARPALVSWGSAGAGALVVTLRQIVGALTAWAARSAADGDPAAEGTMMMVDVAACVAPHLLTGLVGILLEYPVCYTRTRPDLSAGSNAADAGSGGGGNCAAAEILHRHRLFVGSAELPWSFTVPDHLVKLPAVRVAKAHFFLAVAARLQRGDAPLCAAATSAAAAHGGAPSAGFADAGPPLRWQIEAMDLESVCL